MSSHQGLIHFSVRPTAPFRLDWTVWALRRRPMNSVDLWDGTTYRRALAVGDRAMLMAVTQRGGILDVTVSGKDLPAIAKQSVAGSLERLLGIRRDLSAFYELASGYRRLDKLVMRFCGMKPPRFPSVFEGLVNGITCQQLSLTVGIIFLNRLTERCGVALTHDIRAFPRPEDLAGLEPADLREMGYSGSKARVIIHLAQSIVTGQIDLEELTRLDNAQCVQRLVAIKGVGRWTAEYVLLRGLGRIDIFPGDDVGARNGLEKWLHLTTKLDYERVRKVLSKWKEYGGLIFLHLLLKGLDEAGDLALTAAPGRLPKAVRQTRHSEATEYQETPHSVLE